MIFVCVIEPVVYWTRMLSVSTSHFFSLKRRILSRILCQLLGCFKCLTCASSLVPSWEYIWRSLAFHVALHSRYKFWDIVLAMKKQFVFEKLYQNVPFIVLNSFIGEGVHMKLMASMFQNMFPTVSITKVRSVKPQEDYKMSQWLYEPVTFKWVIPFVLHTVINTGRVVSNATLMCDC